MTEWHGVLCPSRIHHDHDTTGELYFPCPTFLLGRLNQRVFLQAAASVLSGLEQFLPEGPTVGYHWH